MVQGRGINASLNEVGKVQAQKVVQYFLDKSIDQIYCSTLVRTTETVQNLNLPIQCLEGFDEISWGSQEGVVLDKESLSLYWDTLELWKNGQLDQSVGGGESPLEVMARQKVAMNQVMSDDHKTVLICMHGRAMRILISWLLNYPLEYMDGFEHRNCAIYKLHFTGVSFRLAAYNYSGHLGN